MDFDEMRKAYQNALNHQSLTSYTEIYTYVYMSLERKGMSHEETHHTAIAITEALSNYQLLVYSRTGSVESANSVIRNLFGAL
jgi:hypothetical protein